MRSPLYLAFGLAGAVTVAGTALAAIDAAQAIKSRQDNLKSLSKSFKFLHDEIGRGAEDKAGMLQAAQAMDKLAGDFANWFPEGSGPQAGIKTAAKPEIWARPADFTKAQQNLVAQIKVLVSMVQTGDKEAIGKAFKDTGGACGACHKEFKVKDAD
jgi:cytochrome c556